MGTHHTTTNAGSWLARIVTRLEAQAEEKRRLKEIAEFRACPKAGQRVVRLSDDGRKSFGVVGNVRSDASGVIEVFYISDNASSAGWHSVSEFFPEVI